MRKRERAFRVTWWDRLLMGVVPGWGMRRVRARATAAALVRSYDYDATGGGRRTWGWHHSSSDANASIAPSLAQLRELSRDLRRNNGWARRGIQAIVNNTVGWGIQARPVSESPAAEQALALWKAWADSASACDYDGRLPFSGLQRLVMETIVESGEALVVREPSGEAEGRVVPWTIRVLEPDYLDASMDGSIGQAGGPLIQGVEFDARGRRAAYWLYENHPGGTSLANYRYSSVRVPAENVIHLYRVERPGQVRGVPWLSAVIPLAEELDSFEDAELLKQKIAACFGAFVTDAGPGVSPFLGGPSANDETVDQLEPGKIVNLKAGQDVKFGTPPAVVDQAFTVRGLRRIAAALGVTYEDLTGDYSNVNYSSARMARLSHWANVNDWRWNMVIPQLCDGVWRWIVGWAAGFYGWPETPSVNWSAPPMPMLEPDKEGLAYSRLIRNGICTLPQIIAEQGEDPDRQLEEIAASNKRLDELKIWLDCDPRRTSQAGLTQERVGAAGGKDDPSDSDASTDDASDGDDSV